MSFTGVTAEGSMKSVVAQFCDVNHGFLSCEEDYQIWGTELFLTMREVTLRTKPAGEVTRLKGSKGRIFSGKAGWRGSTSASVDRDIGIPVGASAAVKKEASTQWRRRMECNT